MAEPEVEKAREKNKKIGKVDSRLIFNLDDLRFGTHQEVAKYRAVRLKCSFILELGCGVGFQTAAFAKTCKRVIAVDSDNRKIEYAKKNMETLGIRNVEFIAGNGEALDIKGRPDIVFCDPERPPEEQERTVDAMRPNPAKVVRHYSAKSFCFELPPQIQEIPFDCEREYVSVDGKLNRLNIYIGGIKRHGLSAVILPGGHLLTRSKKKLAKTTRPKEYLAEVNPAVIKAGLSSGIPADGMIISMGKHTFITSDHPIESPFVTSRFRIVATAKSLADATARLKAHGFGKSVLRGEIPPDKYWDIRAKIERGLAGNKTAHLFMFDEFWICEKIYPERDNY
ncbi:MAG: class I SAM-dependent methyltransferase [archaeon]